MKLAESLVISSNSISLYQFILITNISTRKEVILKMFSTPGYPPPYTGNPTYGVENPRMLSSKGDGPPRGVPWGHTVVIRGRLISGSEGKDKTDDPETGPPHKDLWINTSYTEGPYPDRGYAKVAKTKKKGKFITFFEK